MTEPSSDPASPGDMLDGGDAQSSADPLRHQGMMIVAGSVATLAAIFAGWYGLSAELFSLQALAVSSAFTALTFWMALLAAWQRSRLLLEESVEYSQSEARESAFGEGGLGWGDGPKTPHQPVEEPADVDDEIFEAEVDRAANIHRFLLFVATALLVVVPAAAGMYYLPQLYTATQVNASELPAPDSAQATTIVVLCLAVACLWLVVTRAFLPVSRRELSEGAALSLAAREAHWSLLLVAGGILVNILWPAAELWVARIGFVWILIASAEQLLHVVLARVSRAGATEGAILESPLYLHVREAVFVRGNPVASVFATIERRMGLSFRSSWAIQFVRAAILPAAAMVLLMFWGLTSLTVVQVDELGVRETFGKVDGKPLGPGLHMKAPWPWGRVLRYPVKKVQSVPLGFEPLKQGELTALLWTVQHAKEEYKLVLGDGAETVAVNATVFYKIREDDQGFLDYAYSFQNPDDALQAFAYNALTDLTSTDSLTGTLAADAGQAATNRDNRQFSNDTPPRTDSRSLHVSGGILSASRSGFAASLRQELQRQADASKLGIEIVDVSLVNLHPPVEAADAYLDVISAAIDRERYVVEARGESKVRKQLALREKNDAVSRAKINAAERVGTAVEESAEFIAIGSAYSASPEAFKQRLWFESLEEILGGKRLFILDNTIGGEGNTVIDLRPRGIDIDPIITAEP